MPIAATPLGTETVRATARVAIRHSQLLNRSSCTGATVAVLIRHLLDLSMLGAVTGAGAATGLNAHSFILSGV